MPSYVVIGASRGLGLEFVRQLSVGKENVVFAAARNPHGSPKLLELQQASPNVHLVQLNLTDPASLQAAAAEVERATGGKLDYLINNAALTATASPHTSIMDLLSLQALEDDFVYAFRTNTVGVAHTTNAFLPLLRHGAAKKIISLSTGLAATDVIVGSGHTAQPHYAVTKAALNMLVAEFAAALAPEGFTVLAISPGLVNTAENPPSPEELEGFKAMVAKFQKYQPDWDGFPLTPEMSVRLMREVIAKAGPKDTGVFLSQYGNQKWL